MGRQAQEAEDLSQLTGLQEERMDPVHIHTCYVWGGLQGLECK